ncbi:hypothetical protein [Gluconobacter oxydans]|uniref:hypothetical protein n=1 Tax=Gluconobacter oxydans TaxID=442 RepID=UPI002647DAC8|nr:hypothetical protein [Gluconobacter oxydans]WKE48118.1 hypothetical protein NUJ38_12670 [Gluconobacter oxydans]
MLLSKRDLTAMRRYVRQRMSSMTLDQHAADLSFIEHATDWNHRPERHLFPELSIALDAFHNIAAIFGRETADKLAALMPQLTAEYLNAQEAH